MTPRGQITIQKYQKQIEANKRIPDDIRCMCLDE